VSNICYRLARQNERFDPEYAGLAGLMHGIGEAVLLSYAADDPRLQTDFTALEKVLRASTREIGRVLLTSWRLSPEMVLAAAEASNWQRDLGSSEPDYTDIVIAAQLHALAGAHDSPSLPEFDKVPACRKLGLKRLSTETSKRLLDAGNKAVAAAASVIAA
jgi:HD-like signal output (HDOD) protein